MTCPVGCRLGNSCRYAQLCADIAGAAEDGLHVAALTEVHVGRVLGLPIAGRSLPVRGTLTGLWPFSPGMHAVRLDSGGSPTIYLVSDEVWVELWD